MHPYGILTRRSDFTAARKGKRAETRAFTIQALRRGAGDGPARFGLTVTKKTGNAVERNRIKRRLRALVRALPADAVSPGCDHVLFARRDALKAPFSLMAAEAEQALRALAPRLAPRLARPPRPAKPVPDPGAA